LPLSGVSELAAVYDDANRTIYLSEGWIGVTFADLSILVHEMVHHLQNVGQLKYSCPHAREAVAFAAQER
jgi:Zn-dependent membrane protease YugP